ncbi:MAG: hypothetical protein ACI9H6_000143 [Patiriisocius sp.]|jgi:hypothetical protein
MPLIVCDLCNAIDNTSFAIYWERNEDCFDDPDLKGKALCSACSPSTYSDGEPTRCKGLWSGRFTKVIATEEHMKTEDLRNFVHLGPFEHLRTSD